MRTGYTATTELDRGPQFVGMGAAQVAAQPRVTAETHAWTMGAELTEVDKARIRELLLKHKHSFAFSMAKLRPV